MQGVVDLATKAVQALSDANTTKDVTKAVEDHTKSKLARAAERAKELADRAASKKGRDGSHD